MTSKIVFLNFMMNQCCLLKPNSMSDQYSEGVEEKLGTGDLDVCAQKTLESW